VSSASAGRIPALLSFLSVAFINAVVDLGHKILIQNTLFKIYDDSAQVALTAVVNALILLPFILLFTPSGYLSDRFAKPHIMRWAALAAVLITLLITLGYYLGWFWFSFSMTFILAAQSAIYSPAKYGYIREIAGDNKLASANGFIQATTIVAILTGIFLFSILFESLLSDEQYSDKASLIQLIAPLGWILVVLSSCEYILTRRLPIIKAPTKQRFNWQKYRRASLLKANILLMRSDNMIWLSILGLALFWGISQTLLATFPAFAKVVLRENNTIIIQGLLACSGIGIVLGSLLAGKFSHANTNQQLIATGAIGLLVMLWLIPELDSVVTFAAAIVTFGLFGGLFIIPLNALIQQRAASEQLGTILAGNNWVQNVVMTSFLIITFFAADVNISSADLLEYLPYLTAALALWLFSKYWQSQRRS
jgi:acyl-[acyl-carrier-protein]-phospholipid O-acyltransferase/long-chain-fatty-acid--[acyl-carrier-protein] ligase